LRWRADKGEHLDRRTPSRPSLLTCAHGQAASAHVLCGGGVVLLPRCGQICRVPVRRMGSRSRLSDQS
jgi:hypothetical protein